VPRISAAEARPAGKVRFVAEVVLWGGFRQVSGFAEEVRVIAGMAAAE